MRKLLRRFIPFSLLIPALWGQSFSPSQLLEATLSGNGPFVTLGIISDSEQQSTINDHGLLIRKKIELAIQKLGEEVTPLARAERMKLERMWSLPFTGRITDQLKNEAKTLKSGLITGSFSPHDSDDLMLLVVLANGNRTLVFHEQRPVPVKQTDSASTAPAPKELPSKAEMKESAPKEPVSTIPPPVSHKENHSDKSDPSPPGVFNFGTQLTNSRELPKETKRPRRLSLDKKLEHLKLELIGNEILKAYAREHIELSDEEKLNACRELIKSAQNTFLTSSKIEFLRRAFILNTSMKSPVEKIERHTLERLLEHREFINEPDFD